MLVNCDINSVINFLQKKRKEGYESVELIDESRMNGWFCIEPKINFIFCKQEPKVVGIDIRPNK